MRPFARKAACKRASQWISLALDDELSELERAALERHLGRCADCAERAERVAVLTVLIRSAPALRPRLPVVVTPRRVRGRQVAVRVALACALLALIGIGGRLLLPAAAPPPSFQALAAMSLAERSKFVQAEHLRIEPRAFANVPLLPRLPPLAARALV